MGVGTLTFRARYGNVEPVDLPLGVQLRGEVEWIVEGTEAEILTLLSVVGGLGQRVSAHAAILKFGNVVGTFDLAPFGVICAQCGKWGEDVFDSLLEDLTRKMLALPFSATQAGALPHDRSIADRDDVLLHAFVYARHVLLSARGDQSVARALEMVLRDPHRLFTSDRTSVQLYAARRVDSRTIARIASGAEGVVTATGLAASTALARALGGRLPAQVEVPRVEHTFDTAENRFVLEFILQLRALIDRVERIARSKATVFWRNAVKDCEAMRRALGPFERHDIWIDVGRMGHVPIGSSVLQRRRGYKDVLRHHLALRAAARIPLDKETVESQLLGVKDVASLYELWCYFAVVDAVRELMAREPDAVESFDVDVDEVDLPWGFRVAWNGGPTVFYNLSFSQKAPVPRRSSSLLLRPDIVVEVHRAGICELHVFDAKLRVDGVASIELDDGVNEEPDPMSFKKDDVAKMHAYRDALAHVRSARVLYPGTISREFASQEAGAGAVDVVGATPLVPGAQPTELLAALKRILPVAVYSSSSTPGSAYGSSSG